MASGLGNLMGAMQGQGQQGPGATGTQVSQVPGMQHGSSSGAAQMPAPAPSQRGDKGGGGGLLPRQPPHAQATAGPQQLLEPAIQRTKGVRGGHTVYTVLPSASPLNNPAADGGAVAAAAAGSGGGSSSAVLHPSYPGRLVDYGEEEDELEEGEEGDWEQEGRPGASAGADAGADQGYRGAAGRSSAAAVPAPDPADVASLFAKLRAGQLPEELDPAELDVLLRAVERTKAWAAEDAASAAAAAAGKKAGGQDPGPLRFGQEAGHSGGGAQQTSLAGKDSRHEVTLLAGQGSLQEKVAVMGEGEEAAAVAKGPDESVPAPAPHPSPFAALAASSTEPRGEGGAGDEGSGGHSGPDSQASSSVPLQPQGSGCSHARPSKGDALIKLKQLGRRLSSGSAGQGVLLAPRPAGGQDGAGLGQGGEDGQAAGLGVEVGGEAPGQGGVEVGVTAGVELAPLSSDTTHSDAQAAHEGLVLPPPQQPRQPVQSAQPTTRAPPPPPTHTEQLQRQGKGAAGPDFGSGSSRDAATTQTGHGKVRVKATSEPGHGRSLTQPAAQPGRHPVALPAASQGQGSKRRNTDSGGLQAQKEPCKPAVVAATAPLQPGGMQAQKEPRKPAAVAATAPLQPGGIQAQKDTSKPVAVAATASLLPGGMQARPDRQMQAPQPLSGAATGRPSAAPPAPAPPPQALRHPDRPLPLPSQEEEDGYDSEVSGEEDDYEVDGDCEEDETSRSCSGSDGEGPCGGYEALLLRKGASGEAGGGHVGLRPVAVAAAVAGPGRYSYSQKDSGGGHQHQHPMQVGAGELCMLQPLSSSHNGAGQQLKGLGGSSSAHLASFTGSRESSRGGANAPAHESRPDPKESGLRTDPKDSSEAPSKQATKGASGAGSLPEGESMEAPRPRQQQPAPDVGVSLTAEKMTSILSFLDAVEQEVRGGGRTGVVGRGEVEVGGVQVLKGGGELEACV